MMSSIAGLCQRKKSMLAETNHIVRVAVLGHSTRQGIHEYTIEFYVNGDLLIGGVTVDSVHELAADEISDRAIKRYYLPIFKDE
jgi:hypothetical protein